MRQYGMTYSQFMGAALKLNVSADRKVLADLAMNSPDSFKLIVEEVKNSLGKTSKKA